MPRRAGEKKGRDSHYLQIFQHERTVFSKRLDQVDDAWVLGRDAVGDGRRDADDFLEHLDKSVVFVLAGFDLAGFHAEGGFEVHALGSAFGEWLLG